MNAESFAFRINDKNYEAKPGQTILQASGDTYIPNVCYHDQLGPIQTCDTCLVEVNGELIRACATEAEPGMQVRTDSKLVKEAQQEAMSRILENHELYCTVCDNNNGNCKVHNTTEFLELDHQKYEFKEKPYEKDMSHPMYRYDPDQCILCGRCVEACQDLQVNETLSIDWSREHPRVIWDQDVPIDESSCVSCGHCVSVCPCNALMEKSMIGEAGYLTGTFADVLEPMIDLTKEVEPGYRDIFKISEIEASMRDSRIKRTKTVCTYCGVGCSFEVWTKGRHILKVEPNEEAPVNGISTCVKGKWGWDFVNSEERLTKPLIRQGDEFVEASWEDAMDYIAQKLGGVKDQFGPDAIGYIASSKCSNEENFIFQKFARAIMGTNNVDNCARYCQTPASKALLRTVGYGGDSGTIKDIQSAGLVIIIGANTAESHPVLATRIKRAHKVHGQKLIVSDLRKNEMAERADIHLHPKHSTDLIWLNAVAKYIIDQGWEAREFINQRVNGYEEFVQSLQKYTLDYAEELTGISKETLIQVATMIHESDSTCILWAMGVTQHKGGTDTSTAICNLQLVTGNFGKPGTGAYPLRGHNNVQGACDFGTQPNVFPGYESVEDDKVRGRYEHAWGVELPKNIGYNNHEMVDAIQDGKIKAMYLFGEDMALVDANANLVDEAFSKLQFFIVQDVFFSRTARYADVILPAAPSLEKEGTFTNTERRIQRFYPVFEPMGESKPDWEIIQMVANAMGANWNYTHPSQIMDEASVLAPLFAGVSYERLDGWKSLVWPVQLDGTDTPLLYQDEFHFPDGKAKLFPVDWTPPQVYEEKYDLHINNGRLLEHFHEGNMTYKSKSLTHKAPNAWLEVSPELAADRGIKDGAMVRLTSPEGAVKLRVLVTDRVKGNELYLPMNTSSSNQAVNFLTSSEHDAVTDTPNYKETAVAMEVLSYDGEPPLPKSNHRVDTHRNPQIGVRVQDKWNRPDFVPVAEVILKEEV
ncbi:formate dehydrogenase subunit alpha [Paenibacillus dokdonensis]|uniref:Formate dehydrogenase subunit alpha n=1 Tax=Paenibacillus dokdonensis TaxID=2567944 RepID=A0ABU6GRQ1_9BACL|nr:formate dehydrogenase subunit alpha [Paenibacillus dokdonensis]MEC0242449.1 formate dehydrogenase subunit alpha [Paenibacillus dokdonensis]